MLFLKGVTDDNYTQLFNVSKILSITIYNENNKEDDTYIKILMGGGLAWRIKKDSIEYINLTENTKF